jgi:hypothetical protein
MAFFPQRSARIEAMRFRLRTLLIAAGVFPPVAAGAYFAINWIFGEYQSPIAERLAVFAAGLWGIVGLVCWMAMVRVLASNSGSNS